MYLVREILEPHEKGSIGQRVTIWISLGPWWWLGVGVNEMETSEMILIGCG